MKFTSFQSSHLRLGIATLFLMLGGALAYVPNKRRILPCWLSTLGAVSTEVELESLIASTKKATSEEIPFSDAELDSAILSIKNLAGPKGSSTLDWTGGRLELELRVR